MANEQEPAPTPRFLEIIEAAKRNATDLGHSYLGVEHLFLAIIRDIDSVPTQAISPLVDPGELEERVIEVLSSPGYNTPTRKVIPPE
ncbi:Clp protease N-terminal domain-containing protein [Streptomyces sp. JNUCC 64]